MQTSLILFYVDDGLAQFYVCSILNFRRERSDTMLFFFETFSKVLMFIQTLCDMMLCHKSGSQCCEGMWCIHLESGGSTFL